VTIGVLPFVIISVLPIVTIGVVPIVTLGVTIGVVPIVTIGVVPIVTIGVVQVSDFNRKITFRYDSLRYPYFSLQPISLSHRPRATNTPGEISLQSSLQITPEVPDPLNFRSCLAGAHSVGSTRTILPCSTSTSPVSRFSPTSQYLRKLHLPWSNPRRFAKLILI